MAGDTAADVRSLVNQLVNAYSAKQVDGAVALFADDAVFVGTGADEIRIGRSAIRAQVARDLGQAEAVKAWYGDLEVSMRGDAAGLFALVTVEATVGQEVVTMPMRMTATATPTEGQWQFRQAHFSSRSRSRPRASPSFHGRDRHPRTLADGAGNGAAHNLRRDVRT